MIGEIIIGRLAVEVAAACGAAANNPGVAWQWHGNILRFARIVPPPYPRGVGHSSRLPDRRQVGIGGELVEVPGVQPPRPGTATG